MTARYGFYAN
ncbi:uncharacterized protein FTOL_13759 [Fusarium torulosum]|uniref:Uncharacterized protein n=1 Tax=Fusarium torulosum TaxID=33205 RepID=A0AAE8SQJ0_9HYPO|nr:uncharacterized protein FTOL_13759 [Fusarium torulosum]